MKQLNYAIIGWGTISDIHAQAITAASNCRLVSIYTSRPEKVNIIKETYNVDVFNTYDEILKSGVEVVSICTPTGTHLQYGIKAAEFGKHVIVEKPLEVSIQKGKQLIKVCKKHDVKLGVIFQNRYLASVKKIKNLIDKKLLGKIFHVSAYIKWFRTQDYYDSGNWRGTFELDGGGALMNQSIHTIDLLQYFAGEVSHVSAFTGTFTHNKIEVEDSASAVLKFKNGAIGSIEASTSIQPAQPRRIEIHGENGTIILEGDEAIIRIDGFKENFTPPKYGSGADSPLAGFQIEPHKSQFEHITESILANKEISVNGEESLKSLTLVHAIYKSNLSNAVIDVESFSN